METITKLSSQFDRIVSMDEVAFILGKSKKLLWHWWAKRKIMPEPLKVNGRAIGYRESTINDFIEKLEKGNLPQEGKISEKFNHK